MHIKTTEIFINISVVTFTVLGSFYLRSLMKFGRSKQDFAIFFVK